MQNGCLNPVSAVSDLQGDQSGAPVITKVVNRRIPNVGGGWGLRAAMAAVLIILAVVLLLVMAGSLFGTGAGPTRRREDRWRRKPNV